MKKKIIIALVLLSTNIFPAQVLNNKINTLLANKEMMNLIFGSYNTDTEIAVVSKVKGGSQDSITKAENDAITGLQGAIKDHSNKLLNGYLSGSLVSGPGFDSFKMRVFADEIAKELVNSGQKKGVWTTSKNETVVLYTIEKDIVKNSSIKYFGERLDAVINKLTEYKTTFQQTHVSEE